MGLPQDHPVPKDPTFGRIGLQTTLFQIPPSRRRLLGTVETVQVLRDPIYPAPLFIVLPMEVHQE
jgi:hypothetical protein